MVRRLAITRRVDLSDISDGWDGCYAIVTPASYADAVGLVGTDLESMSDTDKAEQSTKLVQDHFVSGKIMILNDKGEAELVDMEVDDIQGSTEIFSRVTEAVYGVTPDPKASSTATETSPTTKPTSEQ